MITKEFVYNFREEIQNQNWTDLNNHDPGITTLEILSYALSDLQLRTQLEIVDYLSEPTEDQFFAPAEILSNAVLNQEDFRKILLDLLDVETNQTILRDAQISIAEEGPEGIYQLGLVFKQRLNESWISIPIGLKNENGEDLDPIEVQVTPPSWEKLPALWPNEPPNEDGSQIDLVQHEDGSNSFSEPTIENIQRYNYPDGRFAFFFKAYLTISDNQGRAESFSFLTWCYFSEEAMGRLKNDPTLDLQFREGLLDNLLDLQNGAYAQYRKRGQ